VACPVCGPNFSLREEQQPDVIGQAAIQKAAEQLRSGGILDAVIHGSRRTVPTKTSISSTGFIVDENSSGCTKSILLQCSLYPLGHIMWFFTRVA
jgi:hypothetical protein